LLPSSWCGANASTAVIQGANKFENPLQQKF
jgi:hypothetical protein